MPSILVVDDNCVNRQVFRAMIASFGCEVAAASSGEEAVLAMRAFGENFQKVADTTVAKRECQRRLVVMDVHLGQGMDGYVAAEMIKADAAAARDTATAHRHRLRGRAERGSGEVLEVRFGLFAEARGKRTI